MKNAHSKKNSGLGIKFERLQKLELVLNSSIVDNRTCIAFEPLANNATDINIDRLSEFKLVNTQAPQRVPYSFEITDGASDRFLLCCYLRK